MNVVTRAGRDTLARARPRCSCRDDCAAGAAGHLRPHARAEAPPFSRAAVLGRARRARSCAARPGGSRRSSTATRTRSSRSASATPRPARSAAASPRRRSTTSSATGRVDVRASAADTLSLRYVVEDAGGRRGEHARPGDRLRLAAPGRARNRHHQGLADLDAHPRPGRGQHAARELQRLPQRDRPGDARPPAHVPEHPGRGQLPRAAGHDAEALAGERLALLGEGRPHAALRRRGRRARTGASTSASSATGASSSSRTSRSSTSTATAASTTTTCSSRSPCAAASPTRTSCSTTATAPTSPASSRTTGA